MSLFRVQPPPPPNEIVPPLGRTSGEKKKKKGSCAKLTDSPLNGGEVGGRWEGGFVCQIAACLNRKVRVEDVKILSPADVMGLSVLVCVCVRACVPSRALSS